MLFCSIHRFVYMTTHTLTEKQREEISGILRKRFENNMKRHNGITWQDVNTKLQKNTQALWSLYSMEATGGEPDVLMFEQKTGEYIFYDCSAESPSGRRSVCYDRKALDDRKENIIAARKFGIDAAEVISKEFLFTTMFRV